MNKIKTLFFITLAVFIIFAFTTCEEEDEELETPKGVVATLLADNRVHITWDAVSGAKKYYIKYRTNMDSTSTRSEVGSTTNTVYYHSPSSSDLKMSALFYYVQAHSEEYDYSSSEDNKKSGWGESNPVPLGIKQQ